MTPPKDHTRQILAWNSWLQDEMDMPSSRMALQLRLRGINSKQVICAKIFPNTTDPVSGILITPDKKIYQFGYNLSGKSDHIAEFEKWIDITKTFHNHRWRDEILTALSLNPGR